MRGRSVRGPTTVGADRAHDARLRLGPGRPGSHPTGAKNEQCRRNAIDRRSGRRLPLVEEIFGWIKTVGDRGMVRCLGRARNKLWFELTAAAYHLTRLANLEAAAA